MLLKTTFIFWAGQPELINLVQSVQELAGIAGVNDSMDDSADIPDAIRAIARANSCFDVCACAIRYFT